MGDFLHNAKTNEYSHIKIYKLRREKPLPAHKLSQNTKTSKYLCNNRLTLLNKAAIIQAVK